jgi:LysR family glycine cleavage system transcriptional activator
MNSDESCELDAPLGRSRLPSLIALRCFEAAARHENFSRAADELCLTHGAVSRAVRLLEDDLRVALFVRRSRRVFLTDAGRKLAKAVHDGLGLMRQAADDVRIEASRVRRWVLSCEPRLLMRWLIPRWPDFQARHPGIDIHLLATGGAVSFDSGIDFAIRRDDFSWPPGHHAETLFVERIGPVSGLTGLMDGSPLIAPIRG